MSRQDEISRDGRLSTSSRLAVAVPAAYLAKLNAEQRRAVEHRGESLDEAPPLLIIAGAGSGKTNALAHRVAHLIVGGVDPRRIMLLTFSRRAASEMQRRVERITAQVLGAKPGLMIGALGWSGTFHAIGARLLREYAQGIGLDRAFTIHDREDSADLMNLVRHDLGFSKLEERFPAKATCLAIYSRTVNAEAALDEVLGSFFPWCAGWEAELRKLFAAYVEAKQCQNVLDFDDLLLYWAQMMGEPSLAADVSARFRRRMHPLRSRDRHDRGDRGGAPAPIRRHDAGQGPFAPDRAATFLRPFATKQRRSARVCIAYTLHSCRNPGTFGGLHLADGCRGCSADEYSRPADRHRSSRAPDMGLKGKWLPA
jgi:hypothetical protein